MKMQKMIRCAIYTRKSVEEGLASEFNTLESQRSYCEDYIKGQKHNGWIAIPERYDDGGYSGKNMNRPAMKRLQKDIENGEIDVIVVYKVDRLSRSLLDFANFFSYLEEHNVSIVLVTQNVDTTTTMGRMQLNLLMVFAQYEREMSSDRIRDKVAAMKKRGMWTGGPIPFGYTTVDRHLEILPHEARAIQRVFKDYTEITAPSIIASKLNQEGIKYKNGKLWTPKAVLTVLSNNLYRGIVRFEGKDYRGNHIPIVTQEQWDAAHNATNRRLPYSRSEEYLSFNLLRTKVFCASCGAKMRTEISKKDKYLYNYYVCRTRDLSNTYLGKKRCNIARIPGEMLDKYVLRACQRKLKRIPGLGELLLKHFPEIEEAKINKIIGDSPDILSILSPQEQSIIFNFMVKRINIGIMAVQIVFDGKILTQKEYAEDIVETIDIVVKRESNKVKLLLSSDESVSPISQETIRILRAIFRGCMLLEDYSKNYAHLSCDAFAKMKDIEYTHLLKLMKLANISPRIILALMTRESGYDISIKKLLNIALLPWEEQECALLGNKGLRTRK